MVHLGIVITKVLAWDRNVTKICQKAYPRVTFLTKHEFVGVKLEDLKALLPLYRRLTEYCSTALHSSLTFKLSKKLENVQKVCSKVFINVMYVSYEAAL